MNAIENTWHRLAGPLCVGFQEHFQNLKYGNGKSKFAQQTLDCTYGRYYGNFTYKRKYDEHP